MEQLVTLLSALDGVLDEALAVMAEAAPTIEDGGQAAGQAGAQEDGTPRSGGSGALVPAFRQAYGQVAAACAVYSQVLHAGQVSSPGCCAGVQKHGMAVQTCAMTLQACGYSADSGSRTAVGARAPS